MFFFVRSVSMAPRWRLAAGALGFDLSFGFWVGLPRLFFAMPLSLSRADSADQTDHHDRDSNEGACATGVSLAHEEHAALRSMRNLLPIGPVLRRETAWHSRCNEERRGRGFASALG